MKTALLGSNHGQDHDHDHGDDHSHDHDHGHPHRHGHAHDHHHGHGHPRGGGPLGWLATVFHWHGHDHDEPDLAGDPAFASREGVRTVWTALAALALTTVLQIIMVALSGSVALLADTVHNFGDMLNSVPLLIAFYLARRAATRQYTYGFGRAEDVAGVVIVLSILFSAGYIVWESIARLVEPQPIEQMWWVAAAAVIGFAGNEAVASFQIRTGARIGSASLVADGLHARIDGLTSLVVLVAVAGSALGFPIIDPIVGVLIGIAILFIAHDATMRVWHRLMDAVDPRVVGEIEQHAREVPGVDEVARAQVRWVGHRLYAEIGLVLVGDPTLAEGQRIVAAVKKRLFDNVRHLHQATVEIVPAAAPAERRRI